MFDLLYPNLYSYRGLDDPDFDKPVTKEVLLNMLKANKYDFPQEEFDLIFDLAQMSPENTIKEKNNIKEHENLVTYKAFLEVVRNLKRRYLRYRTLFKN